MNDFIQSGKAGAAKMTCAQCEDMLADALDGTLSTADQAAFDLHLLGCAACSSMVADAQRGAAWLEMLRTPRPEPSSALLDRILAQTSGQPGFQIVSQINELAPATPLSAKILPFRSRIASAFRPVGQTLLQPRFAMTAAMAFFSIALTLSLTGVRLSVVRLSDLRPTSIKRSFYAANAGVVRYYDNLSVVYQFESSVHDLQRGWDSEPTNRPVPAPQPPRNQESPEERQPKKQPAGPGKSSRENPGAVRHYVALNETRPIQPAAQPVLVTALDDESRMRRMRQNESRGESL